MILRETRGRHSAAWVKFARKAARLRRTPANQGRGIVGTSPPGVNRVAAFAAQEFTVRGQVVTEESSIPNLSHPPLTASSLTAPQYLLRLTPSRRHRRHRRSCP